MTDLSPTSSPLEQVVSVSEEGRAGSARLNDLIEQVLAAQPSVHTIDVTETRRRQAAGEGGFGPVVHLDAAQDWSVPGPGGDVPVRVFVPERVEGTYLHLHGGGWTIGGAGLQDRRLDEFARETSLAVVSVEYRLAPEHPFPAGPDDCEAVARWLLAEAGTRFGVDRLVFGGESAGAHLAVLTLLRLRDSGADLSPVVAADLVYGCYDLGGTPSQRAWGERNLILSGPILAWFMECFTPGMSVDERRAPGISPLYADLRGLPPARFTVGDLDPLLDDSRLMAERWRAAGNRAELAVYPESIHSFTGLPTEQATKANAARVAFVRRAIDGGRG
jgi:acetyl esterase